MAPQDSPISNPDSQYDARRRKLIERAFAAIKKDTDGQFAEIGKSLARFASPAFAAAHFGISESDRHPDAPDFMLSRVMLIGSALKTGRPEDLANLWFFEGSPEEDARLTAARIFVVAFLLAAEPDLRGVLTGEICELAALPWDGATIDEAETETLGRGCVDWRIAPASGGSDSSTARPGWEASEVPPPAVIDRLEAALEAVKPTLSDPMPSEIAILKVLGKQTGPRKSDWLGNEAGYPTGYKEPLRRLFDRGWADKPSPRGGYSITDRGRTALEALGP